MTQDGDETRRRCRQRGATAASPAGAPPNSSDVLREIFLRLPPLPSSLPRVSLVCKRWRHLVADPEFLLRFRAHHGKAPLLGLFMEYDGRVSFAPVLEAPDRIPPERFSVRFDHCGDPETYLFHGTVLGCRRGRILVLDTRQREVLVCDPITGNQRRVPLPPAFCTLDTTKAAILCTNGDEGHVHGACHSSPFKLALVQIFYKAGGYHQARMGARVYSSETGIWSNIISAVELSRISFVDFHHTSTLVGGSLYWWLRSSLDDIEIVEFDIGRETLSLIDGPPVHKFNIYCTQIIQGEDSGVGVAVLSYPRLQMWDWKVDSGGKGSTWFLRKTFILELVPNMGATGTEIMGYVENDDAILIKFNRSIFIVQLESMQSRKLCDSILTHQCHPFSSFFSSGLFGRCKDIATTHK